MPGGWAPRLRSSRLENSGDGADHTNLLIPFFSESNGRLLVEVAPEDSTAFEACFGDGVALAQVGVVTDEPQMSIRAGGQALTQVAIPSMLDAWKSPVR